MDLEFAAANKAAQKDKQDSKAEVFCELCNNGHNFRTLQAFNQHKKSVLHKKRLDPEFAAADEAAKKAKQKIYCEKETARLAARDKSKAHRAALQKMCNTVHPTYFQIDIAQRV